MFVRRDVDHCIHTHFWIAPVSTFIVLAVVAAGSLCPSVIYHYRVFTKLHYFVVTVDSDGIIGSFRIKDVVD